MGIFNVFEIPVWQVNLKNDVNINEIENYCLQLEGRNGRFISNEGGFQSQNINLHDAHELKDLQKAIQIESKKFSDNIGVKHCEIDNLWVNINNYLNSNQSHRHARSILSGVFYGHSKFNEKSGKLVFRHPCTDLMEYDWAHIETGGYNPVNSLTWSFLPHPCDLIIFPSWLEHRVEPNLARDYKRISISFNMHFKRVMFSM